MSVSAATIRKDVLYAIRQITDWSNYKAYQRVIIAFLLGDEDSWIYEKCCEADGFGDYNQVNEDDVDEALRDLVRNLKIKKLRNKNKKTYYVINEDFDPAYSMLNNRSKALKYDEDFFLYEIADWDAKIPYPVAHPHPVKLKDGYTFIANGQQEEDLVKILDNKSLFTHLRGNNFAIKIPHRRNKYYYPDIVFQTKEGQIGIIEVKEMFNMCDDEVREKYEALKHYCLYNNYLYVMCDDQYNTYDFQRKRKVSDEVKQFVADNLSSKGKCTRDDFDEFSAGRNTHEKTRLKNEISALVIQRGYRMKMNKKGKFYNFEIRKKLKQRLP